MSPRPTRSQAGTLELRPIDTLLQATGLGQRALAQLNRNLEALPLTTIQGSSGPRPRAPVPAMQPGAALGVLLLSGDVEVAGTGTLTWREGNTILAFGHSMAELGEVSLPLCASFVHAILPSYDFSYKMASQIGPVGEMTHDRLWAIGGRIHAPAPMIPLRVSLRDPARGRTLRWNLKVAQHRYLTAPLVGAAATEGIGSLVPSMAQATARMRLRIQPVGLPSLEIVDTAVGPSVDAAVSGRVSEVLDRLVNNPFEPLRLASVQVDVDLLPGRRTAVLERLYTDRTRYRPGDTMRLGVVLKPYGQAPQVWEIELPIPPEAPKGTVKIGVSGGAELAELRKTLALDEPTPVDLDHLLQELRQAEGGHSLAVRVLLPGRGISVGRRAFPLLPAGLRKALEASPHTSVEDDREVLRRAEDTPWMLQGREVLEVEVVEREGAPGKPPAPKEDPALSDLPAGGRAWTLQGPRGFEGGAFQGTALDASGALTPGPALQPLYGSSDALAWSLALETDGSCLVGLGGPGDILRLAGPGQTTSFARTGAAAVLAMSPTPEGLWVGTGPDGEVLRLDSRGTVALRVRLPVAYVWALQPAPGGGAWAATGVPGRLYHLDPDGRPTLLWESGQQHVRSLACGPGGELFAATASQGLVGRMEAATGRFSALFQSPQASVEALTWSGTDLWAASGPTVFRLPGGTGAAIPYEVGPGAALSLAPDGNGGIWAGLGDGGLARVAADGRVTRLPDGPERPVLALLPSPEGLLAARAFSAEVLRLGSPGANSECLYLSEVLDAGRPVRWGSLRWLAAPADAAVRAWTRSGPGPVPGPAWSDWSRPLSRAGGSAVPSPPARFAQIRVRLAPGAGALPRLQGLTMTFTPLAGRPLVALVEPRGGERWSGLKTMKWTLLEGDPARVSYDLALSGDGGATWKVLTRQRPGSSTEETLPLQTDRHPDGPYLLKVSAWDRADPEGSRSEVVSAPLILANTRPKLAWLTPRQRGELRGVALAEAAAVVEVSYRLGQGPWMPAEAADGLFDSIREEFRVLFDEGTPGGRWKIRIRDEAGNEGLECRKQ